MKYAFSEEKGQRAQVRQQAEPRFRAAIRDRARADALAQHLKDRIAEVEREADGIWECLTGTPVSDGVRSFWTALRRW